MGCTNVLTLWSSQGSWGSEFHPTRFGVRTPAETGGTYGLAGWLSLPASSGLVSECHSLA